MSLASHPLPEIPAETARVARAAFRQSNPWLQWRDQLGAIDPDQAFASRLALVGQPAVAPWRLALVTLWQLAEGLTDRPAAEAVRSRLDWKYLLAWPLDDPGFDASVLCEFRERLLVGEAESLWLGRLLEVGSERQWLKGRGRQRTDATHGVAAARLLTRLELVTATFQQALNVLARAAPAWVLEALSRRRGRALRCPLERISMAAIRLGPHRLGRAGRRSRPSMARLALVL
jgi:transposase